MPNPFNGQWIDLFAAGDYGEKGSYTVEDLNHIANGYDPNFSMAPLVEGHPKTEDKARGWVQGMRVVGEKLQGLLTDVNDKTAALMKEGAFKNRSVAIYDDLKGKGRYLRHVGLLGAVPPEVKGLAPVKFDDGEATMKSFDFKDDAIIKDNPANDDGKGGDGVTKEELKTKLELFAENLTVGFNKILAPLFKTNPDGAIPTVRIVGGVQTMSDKTVKEQIAEALDKERATNKAKNFVETMKAKNKWLPSFTEAGLEETLFSLATAGPTITFGEDGKKQTATAFDTVSNLIASIPELVPSGKLGSLGKGVKAGTVRFSAPLGRSAQLDPDSVVRAEDMQKQFAEIRKENPEMDEQDVNREALRRANVNFSEGGGGAQSVGVA